MELVSLPVPYQITAAAALSLRGKNKSDQ